MRRLKNDCFLTDADRLTHHQALEMLTRRLGPVVDMAPCDLGSAMGRVLALPVVAPRAIPASDNAAVDGYAFRFEDYDPDNGTVFRIAGRAAAGHPLGGPLPANTAARILTGAIMPAGADTVVMQEDVERIERDGADMAMVPPGLKPGANRRRAGEDVAEGAPVLAPGRRLRPQDVAAIASTGAADLYCHLPLQVGILASGDEILAPGAPHVDGGVYDANTPMLEGLVAAAGGRATPLGVLPDDRAAVAEALELAAGEHNLLIATGGASQGDEDHMSAALQAVGERHVWQIAIKPGRPITFGQIGDTVFVSLPGNPVAAFVCFLLYVHPIIQMLSGARWSGHRGFLVPAGFALAKKKAGRREFLRARLVDGPNGPVAERFGRDGSGLISSLTWSDGLVELPEDVTVVEAGTPVCFLPYADFGLAA